ncbi:MAG: 16S rRNA (adenine(1518)-N(6)/adenine(1519)-N(6))-dimethyltransferase RsmA [Myxococcota bacterium]
MTSPTDAKTLLARAGLKAKKSWGQNFLKDESVLTRIAAATKVGPGESILELGAGMGALTQQLLVRGAKVTAVERDREMVPILRENMEGVGDLTILEANAGELDYADLARRNGGPLTVAGNLPYQLSSRILVNLADAQPHVARAVLMVQREVAERLVASPGSRTYGLLSVLVQRAFDANIAFEVPPGAFHPPPKVHSAVVSLTLKRDRLPPDLDAKLVAVTRAGFSARRKTLRNSIAGGLGLSSAEADSLLAKAGIEPTRRAETLALDELRLIAEVYEPPRS